MQNVAFGKMYSLGRCIFQKIFAYLDVQTDGNVHVVFSMCWKEQTPIIYWDIIWFFAEIIDVAYIVVMNIQCLSR